MPTTNNHREALHRALKEAYSNLVSFASRMAFQELLNELYGLPPAARPDFVNRVVMNPPEMARRGLSPPPGLLIQRSSFGDRRPTLFCLKQYLPEHVQTHWQNANITFDNVVDDAEIPRDSRAWRRPLPVEVQQALIAGRVSEATIDKVLAQTR